jgi:hypothetical protein
MNLQIFQDFAPGFFDYIKPALMDGPIHVSYFSLFTIDFKLFT